MVQNLLKEEIVSSKNEGKVIDLRAILSNILLYWYLFLISIFLCLMVAATYIYRAPSIWKISGKILVEDQQNASARDLNSGMNQDLGSLLTTKNNVDNEIDLLKSRSLAQKTVSILDLNIRSYKVDGIKSIEIYNEAPFTVNISYNNDSTYIPQAYLINIPDSTHLHIVNNKLGIDQLVVFGRPFKLKQYNITFKRSIVFKPSGIYKVAIETIASATKTLLASYTVSLSGKEATTIDLNLNYANPQKGKVILNTLMDVYLKNNLENKVKTADSTMKFIDNRLNIVGAELGSVEKQLEQYQKQNQIADISTQSKTLVQGASDFYNKLNDINVQVAVINDLNNYLNKPGNRKVVPSSLTTKDPAFGAAINSYNQLLLERDKQKLSYSEANPVVKNLDQQIESGRQNLVQSLEGYQKSLQISKAELNKQNAAFSGKIREVPGRERIFLDYSRQQSLKQELYLFLLQKREETAISKTSTISSSRIVDTAETDELPFAPKKPVIYLIGLLAGLSLPASFIGLKKMLNTKVRENADIEKKTSVQVIGEIGHNSSKEFLVVNKGSQSVISEQFRSFRANLQYILDTKKNNVILFTSSMSGEGKSFLSINLGNALAMTGKKVVVMDLNLRNPKLSENMELDNDNGFTNYIISDTITICSMLKPKNNRGNLSLISSGLIPPNPAELLATEKLEKLIVELKNQFDYVIIVAPPLGIVSDALIIEKFVDVTFYIVRQDYTFKSQLDIINDLQRTEKIKPLYIIVNDIESRKNGYKKY